MGEGGAGAMAVCSLCAGGAGRAGEADGCRDSRQAGKRGLQVELGLAAGRAWQRRDGRPTAFT